MLLSGRQQLTGREEGEDQLVYLLECRAGSPFEELPQRGRAGARARVPLRGPERARHLRTASWRATPPRGVSGAGSTHAKW